MSATQKFVDEHPFLTFFIAMAAIDGVVSVVKSMRGEECCCPPRPPLAPGNSRFTLTPRYPFFDFERGQSPWEDLHSPLYGATTFPPQHP